MNFSFITLKFNPSLPHSNLSQYVNEGFENLIEKRTTPLKFIFMPLVNPESLNPYQKSCPTSPRLSGGGSRDGYYPGPGPTSDPSPTMCCRAPAGGKVPGTAGRSCPAEAGNQSANSGNTTKQLVGHFDWGLWFELKNNCTIFIIYFGVN